MLHRNQNKEFLKRASDEVNFGHTKDFYFKLFKDYTDHGSRNEFTFLNIIINHVQDRGSYLYVLVIPDTKLNISKSFLI